MIVWRHAVGNVLNDMAPRLLDEVDAGSREICRDGHDDWVSCDAIVHKLPAHAFRCAVCVSAFFAVGVTKRRMAWRGMA
ncbi:hypothetical protein HYFRA_00012939 [Hymenoscyphus fraxineus]|uniref:Uncharacterized protein n=1 Tax=Hymenoscyphus fraxineus TaxID=746836 RepID=A0A9N9PYQ6_9HELO|nr:hypothetical protein HYFRA_00012939 [Hymenoscyphus fraxineus]